MDATGPYHKHANDFRDKKLQSYFEFDRWFKKSKELK